MNTFKLMAFLVLITTAGCVADETANSVIVYRGVVSNHDGVRAAQVPVLLMKDNTKRLSLIPMADVELARDYTDAAGSFEIRISKVPKGKLKLVARGKKHLREVAPSEFIVHRPDVAVTNPAPGEMIGITLPKGFVAAD